MEQAALMWKLRVKIDVWSKGVNESLRQHIGELLTETYLRFSPCRMWIFLKHIRVAFLGKAAGREGGNEPYDRADLYIQGRKILLLQESACYLLFMLDILTLR